MKTKTKNKKNSTEDFDPVKMMRDIRDKLTQEITGMTFEQEKAYLKKTYSKGLTQAQPVTATTTYAAHFGL